MKKNIKFQEYFEYQGTFWENAFCKVLPKIFD